MQVPDALSLIGALLVCSCSIVLGLAEHVSTATSDIMTQSQTWQTARVLQQNAKRMIAGGLVHLWHMCLRNHEQYQQMNTEEAST